MRRARQETSENHERWLVSYADLITLMFAFFVVMYSVSSVNEGKYRVLTETLEGVFSKTQATAPLGQLPLPLQPTSLQSMTLQNRPADQTVSAIELPFPARAGQAARPSEPDGASHLAQINAQIEDQFSDLIELGEIRVASTDAWIEVDIKSNILFESAQAQPSEVAQELISGLAEILSDKPNAVQVEGFTDDLPIKNARFPSNWELSTARASAVLRLLVAGGVDPARLAAIGYAQYQPIASNDTAAGRRKNRRVVLVISKAVTVRRAASVFGG